MNADDPARAFRGFIEGALLPRWADRVPHPEGGFHERLDPSLAPIDLGYRRLLSQCRMLFSFAEGGVPGTQPLVIDGFRWAAGRYFEGDRGWRFALGEGGPLPPGTRHLYAHAFALLACWARLRVADSDEARRIARQTLAFIDDRFRTGPPGFAPALDEGLIDLGLPREQNPQMHLFESCVLLYEQTQDVAYARMAREIAGLFLDQFLDRETGSLIEHFRPDGSPDPIRGRLREPGHHFEWAWLIHRWLRLDRDPRAGELDEAADRLIAWALHHGIDPGGIYDQVDVGGEVVQATRRIWPVCEALKALRFHASVRGESAERSALERALWDLLFSRYLRPDQAGWVEVLGGDLRPKTDYLPATTPYHLVMAARELSWLEGS
ncbi:MAG: AGE family epimerase/isomerase [Isosphaeraceae bacterium]